jgi:hypothetical protein
MKIVVLMSGSILAMAALAEARKRPDTDDVTAVVVDFGDEQTDQLRSMALEGGASKVEVVDLSKAGKAFYDKETRLLMGVMLAARHAAKTKANVVMVPDTEEHGVPQDVTVHLSRGLSLLHTGAPAAMVLEPVRAFKNDEEADAKYPGLRQAHAKFAKQAESSEKSEDDDKGKHGRRKKADAEPAEEKKSTEA